MSTLHAILTASKRVLLRARNRIIRMRPIRNIHLRPLPLLRNRIVRVRVPTAMRRQIHMRRLPIHKPHHRVLPVADVVAEDDAEKIVAVVEGVEVEVEDVYEAVLLHGDDGCGGLGEAVGVGLVVDGGKPGRIGLNIVVRGEVGVGCEGVKVG